MTNKTKTEINADQFAKADQLARDRVAEGKPPLLDASWSRSFSIAYLQTYANVTEGMAHDLSKIAQDANDQVEKLREEKFKLTRFINALEVLCETHEVAFSVQIGGRIGIHDTSNPDDPPLIGLLNQQWKDGRSSLHLSFPPDTSKTKETT